jgi:predicted alpha/beta hydrolase family esterase
MPPVFLFLHGYGGTNPDHWQSILAESLLQKGAAVLFPMFPDPENPDLNAWLRVLEAALDNIGNESLIVAGHSLGCALWLHYLAAHPLKGAKKCFLVSPPMNDCGIEQIADFFPLPELDLSDQADRYQIIGSDNDPFILEEEFDELAEKYAIPLKKLPGAAHINSGSGFGQWDWMEHQCLKYLS